MCIRTYIRVKLPVCMYMYVYTYIQAVYMHMLYHLQVGYTGNGSFVCDMEGRASGLLSLKDPISVFPS